MLVGSHVVAGGGTLVLFGSGRLWPCVLAGTLVLLMLLRARLFKETAQAAVPLITALVAVCGGAAFLIGARIDEELPLLGVAFPVALTVALVTGCVAVLAGRVRLNPRLSRALDVLETTFLLAVVPLALAVWDVYTTLLDLRA
jgi:hypothetical protein